MRADQPNTIPSTKVSRSVFVNRLHPDFLEETAKNIHHAIKTNNVEEIKAILQELPPEVAISVTNTHVRGKDDCYKSLLYEAVFKKNESIVALLLEFGANPFESGREAQNQGRGFPDGSVKMQAPKKYTDNRNIKNQLIAAEKAFKGQNNCCSIS